MGEGGAPDGPRGRVEMDAERAEQEGPGQEPMEEARVQRRGHRHPDWNAMTSEWTTKRWNLVDGSKSASTSRSRAPFEAVTT